MLQAYGLSGDVDAAAAPAKDKIRDANIPFEVPPAHMLRPRSTPG